MKKKRLLKIVVLIVLAILVIRACGSDKKPSEKEVAKILKGKVEVPETLFKTQEEVEAMFKAAGLTPEFIARNFDETAEDEEHYLRTGECDTVDDNTVGVTYYMVSEVGDASGYYADEGATIIVGYSDHDFDGTAEAETEAKESAKETEADSIETETEATETEPETQEDTTEQQSDEETGATEYDEVNEEVRKHLEFNHGIAMGTIDANGNPIENGTPNVEYTNWIYVRSITYDGSFIDVNVTADFEYLTDAQKDSLASSCQGIVWAYAPELSSKPPIYFYNGDIPLGHSKILDSTEYTWE